MELKDKTIITVAPTGTLSPKAVNPNVPITPKEIAEDVYRCYKAGAAIAHLHMRDDNDRGTMDKERFKETVDRIRDKCDIIINCTTSGEPGASYEKRMEHLAYVKPDMATFDAGSFNWIPLNIFDNSLEFLMRLGKEMKANNIKPEFEIFYEGMFDDVLHCYKQGVIEPPFHFQFVLGVNGADQATVANLDRLVKEMKERMPEGSTWSAFGISKQNIPILETALALDGNIRVGLEDTGFFSKGVPADNLSLVERAVKFVELNNKKPATVAEARAILSLDK
ncbi:MAG: 3-keto-5-aminohexanoate cleavage protein [Anaerovoracaceae bacterium]